MIKRLKSSSDIFRSLSVFVLILSFLVLGSCPVKKAIHTLIKGGIESTNQGTGTEKNLAQIFCAGTENTFGKKLAMPERITTVSAPAVTAVIFTVFWAAWSLLWPESSNFTFQEPSLLVLDSVPTYLRNRILLI